MGIKDNQILKINLEDPIYQFNDYMDLYNYVKEKLIPDKKIIYF